jgi:hypothetical protein
MSATDAARASRATPGTMPVGGPGQRGVAPERDDISLGTVLFVDVRVRSLLMGEARKRVVTGAFGIPRGDQSVLVRMILIGAVATVLRDLAPRPWPRLSGADAAIGGSLLNATLRGIAGTPSRSMPIAGALIAFGLLSRSLRPAVVGSAREVRALARDVRSAFSARYGR